MSQWFAGLGTRVEGSGSPRRIRLGLMKLDLVIVIVESCKCIGNTCCVQKRHIGSFIFSQSATGLMSERRIVDLEAKALDELKHQVS